MPEPKPADFFIGVGDFFAIVMPGVIAASLLAAKLKRFPEHPEVIFWVGLFVSGYLIGHMLHAVGSVLDPVLYNPFFEAEEKLETCYLMNHTRPGRAQIGKRFVFALKEYVHRNHQLLAYTRNLVKASPGFANGTAEKVFGTKSLEASGYNAQNSSARPTGVYQWTRAWLRIRSPEATMEVDRLEADSKLFRTLGVVLPIAVVLSWKTLWGQGRFVWLAAVAAVFLSLWRYCDLRQKTIRACYLHFVQLQSEPAKAPSAIPTMRSTRDAEN